VKRKVQRIVVGLVITLLLMTSSFNSANTKASLLDEDLLLHNYLAYSEEHGEEPSVEAYVQFIIQQGFDAVVRHRYFVQNLGDTEGYSQIADVVAINEITAYSQPLMGGSVRLTEVQPVVYSQIEIERQHNTYATLAGELITVLTGLRWPIISFVDALMGSIPFPTTVSGNVVAITSHTFVGLSQWYEVQNSQGNWSPFVVTESRRTNVTFTQQVTRLVSPWDTSVASSVHNSARHQYSPRWGAHTLNFQDAHLRYQIGWGLQVYRWSDPGGTIVYSPSVFP